MQPNYYFNSYTQPSGLKLEKMTLEEIKKAPVVQGQTIYGLDPNEPMLYTKTNNGNSAILRGFQLTEIDLDKIIEQKKFVTREDLETFKADILDAIRGGHNESNI